MYVKPLFGITRLLWRLNVDKFIASGFNLKRGVAELSVLSAAYCSLCHASKRFPISYTAQAHAQSLASAPIPFLFYRLPFWVIRHSGTHSIGEKASDLLDTVSKVNAVLYPTICLLARLSGSSSWGMEAAELYLVALMH